MTVATVHDRPVTRFARLTRWVPTPRRVWRVARRRPRAAAFAVLVLLALGGLIFPHARAAWVGHRLRAGGHEVKFGHYINETARRWAPLPTDSALWKTPVAVYFNGGGDRRPVAAWLDDLDALPQVRQIGFRNARLTVVDARRAAARHRGSYLQLNRCVFEPGALQPFARQSGLTIVSLDGSTLPPGELAFLAGGSTLEGIGVVNAVGVRGQLVPLGGHPTLQWVIADGSSFGDDDLAALATCPALVRLNANRTDVTDAGLAAMRGAPGPFALLLGNARITDAGLAAFGSHPRLGRFDLQNTAVTDAGALSLVENCPNLTSLDLSGTAVTDAALETLAGLSKLDYLTISDTAVTDAARDRLRAAAAADGRKLTITGR